MRKTCRSTKGGLIRDSCTQKKIMIKKEKTDKPQGSKNQTNGLSNVNAKTVSPDSNQIKLEQGKKRKRRQPPNFCNFSSV